MTILLLASLIKKLLFDKEIFCKTDSEMFSNRLSCLDWFLQLF